LFSTILIAILGALVLIGTSAGAPSAPPSLSPSAIYDAGGFVRIFFVAAGSLTIALICLALLREKPLQTSHT